MGSLLFLSLNFDSKELLIFPLGLYLAVSSWSLQRRRHFSQCAGMHKKGLFKIAHVDSAGKLEKMRFHFHSDEEFVLLNYLS